MLGSGVFTEGGSKINSPYWLYIICKHFLNLTLKVGLLDKIIPLHAPDKNLNTPLDRTLYIYQLYQCNVENSSLLVYNNRCMFEVKDCLRGRSDTTQRRDSSTPSPPTKKAGYKIS